MGHRPSSAVPDETPHNASFHQGLHCLLERTPIYVKITEIKTMCKLIVEQFPDRYSNPKLQQTTLLLFLLLSFGENNA